MHNRNPGPTSFTGAPGIGPTGPQRPQQQAARVVAVGRVLPRSVPVLTVGADGQVQPNAEAATLLTRTASAVCFHAPAPVRPGCHARLWEVAPGDCHALSRRADKPGQVRLRAAGACPPPGRYLFTPTAEAERWALVPLQEQAG